MGLLVTTGVNFEQTQPSASWMITHNLGHVPVIDVMVMVNGVLTTILPKNVQHISELQTVVTFSEPRVGKARLV